MSRKLSSYLALTTVALLTLATSVNAAIAPGDIEALYELAGDSTDSSGNAYNGVDSNISYITDGTRGMVASFNGSNSSINVSSTGLLYSFGDTPNNQFSVAFWILPGGSADDVMIIMGGSNLGIGVIEIVGKGSWSGMGGANASGGVGVNSGSGGGKTGNIPAINLNDGNWHHILLQWAGDPSTDIEVWIDGNVASTFGNGYNGNSAAATTIRLGGPATFSDGGSSDKFYTGLMSDVMFFNRQVLDSEVESIMNPRAPTPPPPHNVPTLLEWSMILLSLLLMFVAYSEKRRKLT